MVRKDRWGTRLLGPWDRWGTERGIQEQNVALGVIAPRLSLNACQMAIPMWPQRAKSPSRALWPPPETTLLSLKRTHWPWTHGWPTGWPTQTAGRTWWTIGWANQQVSCARWTTISGRSTRTPIRPASAAGHTHRCETWTATTPPTAHGSTRSSVMPARLPRLASLATRTTPCQCRCGSLWPWTRTWMADLPGMGVVETESDQRLRLNPVLEHHPHAGADSGHMGWPHGLATQDGHTGWPHRMATQDGHTGLGRRGTCLQSSGGAILRQATRSL